MEKKTFAKQKLIREIKIHKSLKHKNIVRFHSYFEDSANYYIVMEICNHRTLKSLLRKRKKITELETRYYIHQLLGAVSYMHTNGVIHRDLKLDNIFIKDMNIKILDMGLSTTVEKDEMKMSVCGTPNYIAPEVLLKSGHSFPVDIWGIGVIMYTLLVGVPPFQTSAVDSTYERIKDNDYTFPENCGLSDCAIDLISSILQSDPSKRPSIQDIKDHLFFQENIPNILPEYTLRREPAIVSRRILSSVENKRNLLSYRKYKVPINKRVRDISVEGLNRPWKKRKVADCITDKMYSIIVEFLAQSQNQENIEDFPEIRTTSIPPASCPWWIVKWIDYSEKCGLGYSCCNNSVGIYFNDSIKAIQLGDDELKLIHRNGSVMDPGTTDAEFIEKRIKYLKYFKEYLQHCSKSTGLKVEYEGETDDLVHLNSWRRTKHGMIFHMSNEAVQINFFDHTKIMLSLINEQVLVTYVNKKGERDSFYLYSTFSRSILESSELRHRLKYARDCINQFFLG
eukprot:TRINITY_DN11517_c0_g1_i1.p1 TRINITY_DN11517_c0_g1~~TRINITY_DN11517_c0_g1_i1.p1  ORF type:complete len:580 (+),score=88.44 TRINITY_DN11517_c0_g1_i1:212-1741(+)